MRSIRTRIASNCPSRYDPVLRRAVLNKNLSLAYLRYVKINSLCRIAACPATLGASCATASQPSPARGAGYSYQAQKQNADRGNWVKVGRGLFRLPGWPAGRHEDLVRLSLWSRGRAVVSHESALSVHELGVV